MMRFGIIVLICLKICGFVSAQQRVLVFSDPLSATAPVDQAAISILGENAPRHSIQLTFTTSPADFSAKNLKNYHGVMFLNASINSLDFRQATELLRFFKLGGGFLGIHKAARSEYEWIWYQKMINATLKPVQLTAPVAYDIITNAFIGKVMLSPLWKMTDQPLLFETPGSELKPVLLDLNGRVGSWYGNTGLGNKAFYTSFGGTEAAFKNPVFIDHLFAGLQEVCPPAPPPYDDADLDFIPEDKNFSVEKVLDQLEDARALKVAANGNIYLLQGGGKLMLYEQELKKLKELGTFSQLGQSLDFSFDPEFATNGYIYFYNPPKDGVLPIVRVKNTANKTFEVSDFGTQAVSNNQNTAKYSPELFGNSKIKLPLYYQNKNFRYDEYKGLQAETKGPGNEVLNIEPFLSTRKFGHIKDMDIGIHGELFLLERGELNKVVYTEDGVFPPVARATADPVKGAVPLKVTFNAEKSSDAQGQALTYRWSFTEKDSAAVVAPVFIIKKPGLTRVKLEVRNSSGLKDQMWLEVEAETVKKKK